VELFLRSWYLARQDIPWPYRTKMFIAVFTRVHHQSLSGASWIQFNLPTLFPSAPVFYIVSPSILKHSIWSFSSRQGETLQCGMQISYPFSVAYVIPRCLSKLEALCKILQQAVCPTHKLEDCPFLAISDSTLSIFTATLHICRSSPPSATWGYTMTWWHGTHLFY
jgi:hypothetical protein